MNQNQFLGLRLLQFGFFGSDSLESEGDVSFLYGGGEPSEEQEKFLYQLNRKALERLRTLEEQEQERTAGGSGVPLFRMDYQMEVQASSDGMEAWMFLFPPENGGADPDPEELLRQLKDRGVVFGVDEKLVRKLAGQRDYLKIAAVARGVAAGTGKDGRIVDCIPREPAMPFFDESGGNAGSGRELSPYREIKAGDRICQLIPPSEAPDGMTVNGTTVKGKSGLPCRAPRGKNTRISEDGKLLLAAVDGRVSFQNGLFQVDPITTVEGDVDHSTGDIDVTGDLIVQGDIFNGMTVTATGNIMVCGAVENAQVIAGEGIHIKLGMNGDGGGSVRAGKGVSSRYLENCTVFAEGRVQAGFVINCKITCNERIDVTSGKGVIIGGTLAALRSIEARTIGSLSHVRTSLNLGATDEFLQEKTGLENEISDMKKEIKEAEERTESVSRDPGPEANAPENFEAGKEGLQEGGKGGPQESDSLAANREMLAQMQRRLSEMEEAQEDLGGCFIRCDTIYPVANIQIGGARRLVEETLSGCHFHLSGGEIVAGIVR